MTVSSKNPSDQLFSLLGTEQFEWQSSSSDEADAIARRVNETLDLLTAAVAAENEGQPSDRADLSLDELQAKLQPLIRDTDLLSETMPGSMEPR